MIAIEDPSYDPEQWNTGGSPAYGIPQALPGSKMAVDGPNWETDADTQLRWMVAYESATYGDACGALAHDQSEGWY